VRGYVQDNIRLLLRVNVNRTTHLHSGIIILDPSAENYASSITFRDGVVSAIDDTAPPGAFLIDLHGQTLCPGFVDSHLHLILGSSGTGDVDLSQCKNRSTFEENLQHGLETIEKTQWLIASGWSEQTLGTLPTIDWVNCIQDVPVLCWCTDFHAAILNSAALKHLDLHSIENIVGGKECKRGIVKETALWEHVAPFIPTPSASKIESRLKVLSNSLHEDGITLVGAMEELKDVENFLFPLREELQIRMRLMLMDEPTADNFTRCIPFSNDPLITVTGFKTFIDGTLGSRTAKMYAPYSDVDSSGVLVGHALQGDIDDWVNAVVHGGFAPVMHAIGDEAVGVSLKSLQYVPRELIPRIEHAQFIDQRDSSSLQGQWFGVQPLHKPPDDEIALDAVGAKRASQLHNWRIMLDSGAKLSFGSDWPIAPHRPIEAMAVAIKSGLTPKEALVATTVDAAKSLREPLAGTLQISSFADATVLTCNPLECDWESQLPSVTMTIVGGVIQFQQELEDE
jgi:predicted amidohydrolase YtcJ